MRRSLILFGAALIVAPLLVTAADAQQRPVGVLRADGVEREGRTIARATGVKRHKKRYKSSCRQQRRVWNGMYYELAWVNC